MTHEEILELEREYHNWLESDQGRILKADCAYNCLLFLDEKGYLTIIKEVDKEELVTCGRCRSEYNMTMFDACPFCDKLSKEK